MNGRYLLDTNAVIALLENHKGLSDEMESSIWIGITVITELEFLSFSALTESDKILFEEFKNQIAVINLDTADSSLIQTICLTRQKYRLKLPDSIVAATALKYEATLLTNDRNFSKVNGLRVKNF